VKLAIPSTIRLKLSCGSKSLLAREALDQRLDQAADIFHELDVNEIVLDDALRLVRRVREEVARLSDTVKTG
jgi:hypothetical protein